LVIDPCYRWQNLLLDKLKHPSKIGIGSFGTTIENRLLALPEVPLIVGLMQQNHPPLPRERIDRSPIRLRPLNGSQIAPIKNQSAMKESVQADMRA